MKNILNSKAMTLKQGSIRAMYDKAQMYGDAINLAIGEPDMPTPSPIIEAGCQALREGKTHYTANAGIIELREALSNTPPYDSVLYDPDEIIVTTGGMGALSLLFNVIVEPGDEVIMQDPGWLNYLAQISYAGGRPIQMPSSEEDYSIDIDRLESCITKNTKAIIINSPGNPTGAVLTGRNLAEVAKIAKKHDLLVISDEVYHTLVYGEQHVSVSTLPDMKERTVVVNSFSKSFAMTGWRLGYAMGPKAIIEKMVRLQENMVACASAPAQYAGLYALAHFDLAYKMVDTFAKRREIVVNGLRNIKGIYCREPKGAFYAFFDVRSTGLNSVSFCNQLLDSYHVVSVPGSAFGNKGEGFVRISYAASEDELIDALKRIGDMVRSL